MQNWMLAALCQQPCTCHHGLFFWFSFYRSLNPRTLEPTAVWHSLAGIPPPHSDPSALPAFKALLAGPGPDSVGVQRRDVISSQEEWRMTSWRRQHLNGPWRLWNVKLCKLTGRRESDAWANMSRWKNTQHKHGKYLLCTVEGALCEALGCKRATAFRGLWAGGQTAATSQAGSLEAGLSSHSAIPVASAPEGSPQGEHLGNVSRERT